jgi:hypothetical protein
MEVSFDCGNLTIPASVRLSCDIRLAAPTKRFIYRRLISRMLSICLTHWTVGTDDGTLKTRVLLSRRIYLEKPARDRLG